MIAARDGRTPIGRSRLLRLSRERSAGIDRSRCANGAAMSTEIITTTLVKNKRNRRSNGVLTVLDRQILNALSACWPQSGFRRLFYKMTDPRPRCAGSKERPWVRERLRRSATPHPANASERLAPLQLGHGLYAPRLPCENSPAARQNSCAGQPGSTVPIVKLADSYVEVWCESRSNRGRHRKPVRRTSVSLYPSGGFFP